MSRCLRRIEIDEIDLVPLSSVTSEDLAQTGEPDLENIRRRAAHACPIHDDTLVYRVEFHFVRPPGMHAADMSERTVLRFTPIRYQRLVSHTQRPPR